MRTMKGVVISGKDKYSIKYVIKWRNCRKFKCLFWWKKYRNRS